MLAHRLDDLGFHVFAGCLFPEGVGASSLRNSGSHRLHVISLNVTSDHSVEKAVDYVKEHLKKNVLWAIVNNAGIAELGELHWLGMESIQRVLDVNTMGVVRVTKAFLTTLIESKGRIITVASLGGRNVIPALVPYCMSKSAVITFCDGLRLEMFKWGVKVVTIEPSFHRTPMTSKDEITNSVAETWKRAPEEIKDMYNASCIDNWRERYCNAVNTLMRHPSEVVSAMEDAITAVQPEYSYSPGGALSKISAWLLQRLPKPVADLFIRATFGTGLLANEIYVK